MKKRKIFPLVQTYQSFSSRIMIIVNNPNQNLIYNNEQNLLLIYSEIKDNYQKSANFLICFNFILFCYSFISFLILSQIFEHVQISCSNFITTISLNILANIINISSIPLIVVAVQKKSDKYYRKYMILILGCLFVKILQYFYYLCFVKALVSESKQDECKNVIFIEEKESTYFLEFFLYIFIFCFALRLKRFLIQMIEINRNLTELGLERRNDFESLDLD